MHPWDDIQILLLISAANAAPLLARMVLGKHLEMPIDNGYTLPDHQPLFGASKSWRGFIAGLCLPLLLAALLPVSYVVAFIIGLASMCGDLIASFCKRRLQLPAESRSTGLDQLPESLLPAAAAMIVLPIGWLDVIVIAAGFMLLEIRLSPLLCRLGLRKHPY